MSKQTLEEKALLKIMILGAGVYQVPLIRRARERGLYTLAVSIPGNYPGFAWADRAAEVVCGLARWLK